MNTPLSPPAHTRESGYPGLCLHQADRAEKTRSAEHLKELDPVFRRDERSLGQMSVLI